MNTDMTGFRWFQKSSRHCALDVSSISIGRVMTCDGLIIDLIRNIGFVASIFLKVKLSKNWISIFLVVVVVVVVVVFVVVTMSRSSSGSSRGPHRYRRTVRIPILRPKIPVKKRIISNRYFGTGTMTEKSAEKRDRRKNISRIRDRVIRLSRSIHLRSRDRG